MKWGGGLLIFDFIRRYVQVRKARRLLCRINSGQLTFDEARTQDLLPPMVTSYWLLEKIANSGSIFS